MGIHNFWMTKLEVRLTNQGEFISFCREKRERKLIVHEGISLPFIFFASYSYFSLFADFHGSTCSLFYVFSLSFALFYSYRILKNSLSLSLSLSLSAYWITVLAARVTIVG